MIEATTRPPDGKDAHSHPERSHSAQKSLAIALRQSKNSTPPATKSAPQRLFPQPVSRARPSEGAALCYIWAPRFSVVLRALPLAVSPLYQPVKVAPSWPGRRDERGARATCRARTKVERLPATHHAPPWTHSEVRRHPAADAVLQLRPPRRDVHDAADVHRADIRDDLRAIRAHQPHHRSAAVHHSCDGGYRVRWCRR